MGQTGSFVLEALAAESFANACEWLGAEGVARGVADTIFYCLNSYRRPTHGLSESLAEAARAVGAEARFRILMLAFFESNLTPDPADEAVMARISAIAGVAPGNEAVVQSLIREAFRLNTGFRDFTTPMWFELNGHKREFEQLVASERLGVADVAAFIDNTIPRLWTVLQQYRESEQAQR